MENYVFVVLPKKFLQKRLKVNPIYNVTRELFIYDYVTGMNHAK